MKNLILILFLIIGCSSDIEYIREVHVVGTVVKTDFGDSITYAVGDPAGNGYRREMNSAILEARPSLILSDVGPNTNGDAPTNRFCATVGATVEDMAAIVPATFGVGLYQPNVMSILIGTNNAVNQSLADAFLGGDYSNMMLDLHSRLPACGFMVWELPPGTSRQRLIDYINAGLPAIWTSLEGAGLILERVRPRIYPPADYFDALHPQPVGYAKMGRNDAAPAFLRLIDKM